MGSFKFSVKGKDVVGSVESVKGFYRARGKCPFCKKEFTVGFSPGNKKTQGEVKASLKQNITRHANTSH